MKTQAQITTNALDTIERSRVHNANWRTGVPRIVTSRLELTHTARKLLWRGLAVAAAFIAGWALIPALAAWVGVR